MARIFETFWGKTKIQILRALRCEVVNDLIVGGTLECDTIDATRCEVVNDLTVGGDAEVAGKISADSGAITDGLIVGGTLECDTIDATINGDTTIADGKKLTKGATLERSLTKTADYVITDTDPDLVFVKDPANNVIITLPTVIGNTGRTITVALTSNTSFKSVALAGSGSDVIYPASPSSSVAYSAIKVTCDGTGWVITGSSGTWT